MHILHSESLKAHSCLHRASIQQETKYHLGNLNPNWLGGLKSSQQYFSHGCRSQSEEAKKKGRGIVFFILSFLLKIATLGYPPQFQGKTDIK
jgi:hypothetical protein